MSTKRGGNLISEEGRKEGPKKKKKKKGGVIDEAWVKEGKTTCRILPGGGSR